MVTTHYFVQVKVFKTCIYILVFMTQLSENTDMSHTETLEIPHSHEDKQWLFNYGFNNIPQMLKHLESTSHCSLKNKERLLRPHRPKPQLC